jgi:hypothetical protein
VARFLRTVFGASQNHRMFQADVLRWKCIAPHPFWEGSRGYALRHKGEIAAFGCVVPCRFLAGSGTVSSCDVIDWAAGKTVPGAGVILFRHIQSLTGTMITIGGTADTRRVLPKIGFEARIERHNYTRVLRPWRNFRQAPKDWKSPLRLARDYRELGRPAHNAVRGLMAHRVDSFDGADAGIFPDPAVTGQVVCARTPQSLHYSLACPAAKLDAYLLQRGQTPAGYFLLSRVGCQCRIADLWIRSPDRREWAEAYATAAATARMHPEAVEVAVAVSSALETGALQQAGYRRTHAEPVFVSDPGSLLAGRGDLAVNLLENDGYYWSADSG